jgi:hypothetical protein
VMEGREEIKIRMRNYESESTKKKDKGIKN